MKTRLLGSGLALAIVGMAGAQVPANDECSSATTISADAPVFFSTEDATGSPQAVSDAQCSASALAWGAPEDNPDVWFAYTPDETGVASFSTCDAAGYDTSMVIYTGSCDALTQVACNGDGEGESGCQQYYSRISDFAVEAGVSYLIRIGGWNGDFGSSTLTVTFTPFSSGCLDAEGDCGEPHPTPGCNDAACCQAVCDFEPFCCDVEWDVFCADSAVKLCGIYVYQCPDNPSAPSNNCPTDPIVVDADEEVPFNNTLADTVGPEVDCGSGKNDLQIHKDLYYQFTAVANGEAVISTCLTATFDTKIAIYDIGDGSFDPQTLPERFIACNEDGPDCPNFASLLTVSVSQGTTYLVRLGGYITDQSGTGIISFDLPEPCLLPDATSSEAEACGENTDGGCTDPDGGFPSQPIALGDVVAGTFYFDGETRDTDWYRLTLAEDTSVTVDVYAAAFVDVFIVGGACGSTVTLGVGSGACPSDVSSCLSAGEYWVFVAPSFDSSVIECDTVLSEYVMAIEGVPATCPESITTSCADPGPDSYSTAPDVSTFTAGLIACAFGGAPFPDCQTGGTTVNSWAKVIPADQVLSEITCVNLGVWSLVRDATTTETCGFFASDIPLPATIAIYRDINGGAPTRPFDPDGECPLGNCDLELIAEREVIVPGGAYFGTLTFDPPLCLENIDFSGGETLVVTMTTPNLANGSVAGIPAQSGYQLRASGQTITGQPSNTFVRLSCVPDPTQYVPAESLNPAATAQWRVDINGNATTCEGAECIGDINGDGVVNGADLSILLGAWGTADPLADLNGDGTVNGADLSILLGAWGNCG